MKYLALLLMLLLFACAKQQDVGTQEPAAPAEPELVGNAEEVESGTDKVFGEKESTAAIGVDQVRCDRENRAITFSFKNNDVRNWQMNQQVPFPAPKDLAAVRVYINSYEVNGRNPYLKDGERQFGPEERFSDNCGGVELLKPGEVAVCTVYPVPLKAANELIAGKNEILVHSPTSKHIIQFTC